MNSDSKTSAHKYECLRVFTQAVSSEPPETVLASINFGCDRESFYRRKMPYDSEAPRQITRGSLDPINEQSEHAPDLLWLFQGIVADTPYRLRLMRHYVEALTACPQKLGVRHWRGETRSETGHDQSASHAQKTSSLGRAGR